MELKELIGIENTELSQDEFGISNRFYIFIFIIVTSIVLWNYIESADKLNSELDYLEIIAKNRDAEVKGCNDLVESLGNVVAEIGRPSRQSLRHQVRERASLKKPYKIEDSGETTATPILPISDSQESPESHPVVVE